MHAVIGEFEQGSVWDARILFSGVLFAIAAFVSTLESDIWQASDRLLLPLLSIGVSLVVFNVLMRIVRPKLQVSLLEINGRQLKVCPVENLQFSGWVAKKPVTVEIADISNVKAYDFYNTGTKTGMYWICLEFRNRHVIEFNIDDPGLVKDIIEFFEDMLPDVDLTIDARIKN